MRLRATVLAFCMAALFSAAPALAATAEFTTPPTPASLGTVSSPAVSMATGDGAHYALLDMDRTMVGWWRFEGNANDDSGYGNSGALNGISCSSSGKFGSACSFSGTGYIGVSSLDGSKFDMSKNLTFSAWIRKTAASDTMTIFSKTEPSAWGASNKLFWVSEGKLEFQRNGGGIITSSASIPSDTWTHVAMTYDKSSLSVKFFINGNTAQASGTLTGNLQADTATSVFRLGRYAGGTFGNFAGLIDDALLFNRTLSAAEVMSLYDAQVSQYQNTFSGLANGAHAMTGHAVDATGKAGTGARTFYVCSSGCGPSCTACAAGQQCSSGACVCQPGHYDCDSEPANGCESQEPCSGSSPGFEPSVIMMLLAALVAPLVFLKKHN